MNRLRLLLILLVSTLLIGIAGGGAWAAQRITNIAQISWDEDGVERSASSNPVVTPVEDDDAIITIFRRDPASPITAPIVQPRCHGEASAASAGDAVPAAVKTAIAPVKAVNPGEDLFFKLHYPAGNIDRTLVDHLVAVLRTRAGDRETLTVFETGVDTGDFIGMVPTTAVPPAPVQGDCVLSLADDDSITVEFDQNAGTPIAQVKVDVLADPYGRVFDSDDGGFVSGARVTLFDADTGAQARVFAADGKTPYPSSMVTGQSVTDGAGTVYPGKPGQYRFPLAPKGRYRLLVEPPQPYTAPSAATPAELARLARPNGLPFAINDGSYGKPFMLDGSAAIRVDLPVDRPTTPLVIAKTASRGVAQPGDAIVYTVTLQNPDIDHVRRDLSLTDLAPVGMRLRPGSLRIDGQAPLAVNNVTFGTDGRSIALFLRRILGGATRTITYVLDVRSDAGEGQAINRATVVDPRGRTATASVAVRITREEIAGRMTLIGRVVDAPCSAKPPFPLGMGGVRVVLEDGSYAVTDRDGRYHFEGLLPGTHVVQVDPSSLGTAMLVDCTRSTRSAGSAGSRFVEGQGGSLVVADFHAVRAAGATAPVASTDSAAVSDKTAAGAERNWFANGEPSIAWLFPEPDHNPRARAIRVAIRHLPGQNVRLFADGKPVDAITFDGSRTDPTSRFAVSLWRGLPLHDGVNHLHAEVDAADGTLVQSLDRDVRFVTNAARAVYLPDRSRLVADGITRPLIAVRFVDGAGHPVHAGSVGDLALSAPYEAASAVDADQARLLSGMQRVAPNWRVTGDDGVALIALAPTTTSGLATMDFAFRQGGQVRRQRLEAWLSPGDRPWTLVGLAQGVVGKHIQPLDGTGIDPGDAMQADGRVAFYAKGRIKGSWLLTLAYDSAKRRNDQRLTGEIDPNTYYTVYADRSERRFDAASTRKLYVRLERRQFYALFGDFTTGFGDTELGRYLRAGTGFKGEYRGRNVAAQAFAARFETTHRRDEIQGSGLSLGYNLRSRDILANSESIAIEVRDRLRSEKIVERRVLTRFVDYDIDYATGTIRFSAPVLSRSSALDPQFIVADYEVQRASGGQVNAGARATWTSTNGAVRIGATGLHDAGDTGRTTLGAADARIRLAHDTEVRAEIAAGRGTSDRIDAAWLVEVEHHDGRVDVLGYARQLGRGYGVEQQNTAERGRRKLGIDARLRLTDALSLTTSAWTDDDLTSDARRRAARARLEYKGLTTDWRLGATYADDRTDAVASASSTLLEAGVTRRLFDNRLELDASTSLALGSAKSVDFPMRQQIGARFQVTPAVALVGQYEIAHGDHLDARTARIGFDLKPWTGARLTSSFGQNDIPEQGRRAYAAYGLAQSLPLGRWSLNASLDGSRTLNGIDPARVVNLAQPVASGGFIGSGTIITEDFTALTLGATYRANAWSATGRAEYRIGSLGNRAGATLGVIRRLGEGATFGLLAAWTKADVNGGAHTQTMDVTASGAWRPATSSLAVLGKLAWREDRVTGAVLGAPAPVSGTELNVSGDALSRRLVGALSIDWSPTGRDAHGLFQRSEVSLFVGTRYVFDRIAGYDLAGFSTLLGLDARLGLGGHFDIGLVGSVRGDVARRNFAYAIGPTLGISPARDTLVNIGWNLTGFADRDFAAARQTHKGPFVSYRMKFDAHSFDWLRWRNR